MTLHFYKYQGTGNDFVVIDDRLQTFPITNHNIVAQLCDRRFGIGADGLMLLQNCLQGTDFQMIYYNADGQQSSMCGNGGRCMVAFAKFLDIITDKTTFYAIDGLHQAEIHNETVSLKMNDVTEIQQGSSFYFLNTGSPHEVRYVENIKNYPVFEEGQKIRYSENYAPKGTNVNFIAPINQDELFVRTYERGVEDETFSCGTGVTAAALVHHLHSLYNLEDKDFTQTNSIAHQTQNHQKIKTLGGNLEVSFDCYQFQNKSIFKNIYLKGEAKQVFQGEIRL
jgi:diaminopimelate epimerase